MIPVENILHVKPSLAYLDAIDAKNKSNLKKINDENSSSSSNQAKALQVQFKKRETEEEAAIRLKSWSYLQRVYNEEPWMNLKHFNFDVFFGCFVLYYSLI